MTPPDYVRGTSLEDLNVVGGTSPYANSPGYDPRDLKRCATERPPVGGESASPFSRASAGNMDLRRGFTSFDEPSSVGQIETNRKQNRASMPAMVPSAVSKKLAKTGLGKSAYVRDNAGLSIIQNELASGASKYYTFLITIYANHKHTYY